MKTLRAWVALAIALLLAPSVRGQTTQPATTQPAASQVELEKKFQQDLSGAVLVGHYTTGPKDTAPGEEKYTITKASKIPFTDRWLIQARVQFGGKDVTVPLVLPVRWAGDTPVISVTDMTIPGLGTYTARVMIYRGQYAGTWSGAKHGGHLWGKIERVKPEDEAK